MTDWRRPIQRCLWAMGVAAGLLLGAGCQGDARESASGSDPSASPSRPDTAATDTMATDTMATGTMATGTTTDTTATDTTATASGIDFGATAWADSAAAAAVVYVEKDSFVTDQLVWVHTETGETRRLTDTEGPKRNLVYDPRGHRLLYLFDGDVLGVPLARRAGSDTSTPASPDTVLAPSEPVHGFDVHPEGGLVYAVRPPSRGGSGAVLWRRSDALVDTLSYWTGGDGYVDAYILDVRVHPSGDVALEQHAIEKSWYRGIGFEEGTHPAIKDELSDPGFTGSPNWLTGIWEEDVLAATPGVLFSLQEARVQDVVACPDGGRPIVAASHFLQPIRVMPDGRRLAVAEAAPALCQTLDPGLMSVAYRRHVDSLRHRNEVHAIYGSTGGEDAPQRLYDASVVAGFVGGLGPPDRVAFVAVDSTRTDVDYRSFVDDGKAATLFVAEIGPDLTIESLRMLGRNVDLGTDGYGYEDEPPNSARGTAIWVPVRPSRQ